LHYLLRKDNEAGKVIEVMVNAKKPTVKDLKYNFTQILSDPESVLIILPSDINEFIASVWSMKIFKQKFKTTTFLLKNDEWKFFPELLFQNTNFNFLPYKHLDNYLQQHDESLVVFLTASPDKSLLEKLKKKHYTLAGMNTSKCIEKLQVIINVKTEYSCAQNLFNFACQLCNIKVGFMEYVHTVSVKQNQASGEQIAAIDISKGIHGTRFLRKHIFAMIDILKSKGYSRIILIDTNSKYYKKLEKRISQKVQTILTDEWHVLFDSLINFTILISHNSQIAHLAQLTKLPSYIFMMPYEHKHIFGMISQVRVFITSFGALSVKQLEKQLERLE